MPCRRAATCRGAFQKSQKLPETENPGSIDLQCPGESKWRDSNKFLSLVYPDLARFGWIWWMILTISSDLKQFNLFQNNYAFDMASANPQLSSVFTFLYSIMCSYNYDNGYQLFLLSAVKADFTKGFFPFADDHFMPGTDNLHHIP